MTRFLRSSLSRYSGLKGLLGWSKPYRQGFVLAFVLLVIATVFEMASPWVMKIILDQYIGSGSQEMMTLAWLGGALLLTYIGASLFQYGQSIIFNNNALEVIHDIRQQVFAHLLTLPMRYFDSEPTGRPGFPFDQ